MTTISLASRDGGTALPRRATAGAFGYDLATRRDETIDPHATVILDTGLQLAADLPVTESAGLAMLILPRSSLPIKHGLILPNSPGLIDADYAGPIGIIVHNLRDTACMLPAGTRVAQALFVECRFPALVAAEPDPSRTRGGFGSTGA